MKTNKIIIILVIVVVLAAGVWIYLGTRPQDTTEPAAGTPEAKKATEAAATVTMPLKQGSRGELVKSLQTALNAKYKAGLKVDGDWGAKTQAALTANNLPTTIYWKEWNQITGLGVNVGGKIVLAEKAKKTENSWQQYIPNLYAGMPASNPNYFGTY